MLVTVQLPAWAGDAAPPDHESSEDEVHNVRSGARAPPKLRVGMAGSRGPAGRRPASPDQLDDRHMDEAEIVQLSSSDLGSDNEGSDSDSSVPGDVVIVNAVDEPEVVDELQISSMRASIRDKLRAKSTATAAAPAADVGPALEAMPFDAAPKAVRRGLHSDEEASEDDIPGERVPM